jgi:hypothetical protein
MGYKITADKETMDQMRVKYGPRQGLEGPFLYVNGQVLYYDPKEGKYWDPKSDFYMSDEEMTLIHERLLQRLSR